MSYNNAKVNLHMARNVLKNVKYLGLTFMGAGLMSNSNSL